MQEQLVDQSITFCLAPMGLRRGDSARLEAGVEGWTVRAVADLQRFWDTLLKDADFRKDLNRHDISPLDFHQAMINCQNDFLDRRRADFYTPGPYIQPSWFFYDPYFEPFLPPPDSFFVPEYDPFLDPYLDLPPPWWW